MDSAKVPDSSSLSSYTCSYCDKIYANKKSYIRHINRHPEACSYNCQDCTKTYHLEKGLRVHRSRCHHDKQPHVKNVKVPTKKQDTSLVLNSSSKMSKNFEKKFCCQVCRTVFSTNKKLKEHSSVHTKNPKNYSCKVCQKNFSSKAHRTEHALTHKKSDDKENMVARVCSRKSETPRGPLDVITNKRYDKFWKCEMCGKGFTLITKLKNHESTHGKMALFDCDLCDKIFADLAELDSHKIHHSQETIYECNICNKQFSCRYSLTRHNKRKSHYQNRPREIACGQCEKMFRAENELKRHSVRCHPETKITIFTEE